MLPCGASGYGSEGGKVFPFDNIIEKFFKDHHDKEGLDNLKECASIEAFQKLPLHKHAGFLMFDSGIYALQDFVNMYIRFEADTEIHYFDRR